LELIPFRVPHCLPAVRPGGRTDSPELPAPFNGITPGKPHERRACPVPPRFRSQVFSTSQRFPSPPELHGLVSCRNRPWDALPSESSPRRNRAPLSGPPAPLPSSTDVPERDSGALTPSVSPTPTLSHAVAWFPRRLRTPFPHVRRRASRSPSTPNDETAPFRQLHRLRSFHPPASPFAPARVAPTPAADTLLGFFPSRAFAPHASGSRTRPC